MAKVKDITGNRYGRLVAVSIDHKNKRVVNGKTLTTTYWKCKCDCGNECVVAINQLTANKTKSCGCLQKENQNKIGIKTTTHGDSKTRFYRIWRKMNERCYDKNHSEYNNYGGKGIIIEWKSYEDFKKDMYDSYKEHSKLYGEKETTIDRINPKGNYCKSNCRWSTRLEQAKNKNNTIKVIKEDGSILTIPEVSDITNIKLKTLESRYRNSKYNKTGSIPYYDLVEKFKR